MLDIQNLTLDQVAELEELIGVSITDFAADEFKPTTRTLIAIAYIVKKQGDPNYTLADAGALKLADLEALNAGAADPEPPSA